MWPAPKCRWQLPSTSPQKLGKKDSRRKRTRGRKRGCQSQGQRAATARPFARSLRAGNDEDEMRIERESGVEWEESDAESSARSALHPTNRCAAAMPKGKERERERERLSTSNFYSECEDRKRDKFLKVTHRAKWIRPRNLLHPAQSRVHFVRTKRANLRRASSLSGTVWRNQQQHFSARKGRLQLWRNREH